MILDQALKYITELKRQNDELLLNGGNNEQGKDFRILTFCCFFSLSGICVTVQLYIKIQKAFLPPNIIKTLHPVGL